MKRVHNNAPTSPPPSGKNKRKNNDAAENQLMEKAPRRANSPRVVVQTPKEPSWADQYQQEYQKLVAMVNELRDPSHPNNMKMLHNSAQLINSLQQKSKFISQSAMAGQSFVQQSG